MSYEGKHPIPPISGGTGLSSPTAHAIPIAEGTANYNLVGPLITGQLLGGVTNSDPLAYTPVAGANMASIIADAKAQTLTFNANNQTLTTPVSTVNGGTGIVSPTANRLLIAEGANPFNLMPALTTGQVPAGVTSADPKPYNLIAGTNMTSIIANAGASTITFNASTQGGSGGTAISHRWYVASDGNDSNTGSSVDLPFATLTHAMSAASAGDSIVLLNPLTETNVALIPNITLVGDGSYPSLSVTNLTLSGGWGGSNQFLGIIGINLNVVNRINWSFIGFNFSFSYKIKLQDLTLTNSNGAEFHGLINGSGAPKAFVTLDRINANTTSGDFISLCDITYDDSIVVYSLNSNLGGTFLENHTPQSATIAYIDGGSIGVSGSSSLTLTSPSPLIANSNCLAKVRNLAVFMNASPKLFTLSQGMGNGNFIDLIMDAQSYDLPTITGTGIPQVDFSLEPGDSTDAITWVRGTTSNWNPINFTVATDLVQSYPNLTDALSGIDTTLIATNHYKFGLNFTYNFVGPPITITIGTGSCKDSTGAFLMVNASPITIDITVSGAGGLDTGSYAVSTWYAIYLIQDTVANTYSVIFSTNFSSPVLPGNYNIFRYIGSTRSTTIGTNLMSTIQTGTGNEISYFWNNADSSLGILMNGHAVLAAPGTINCIGGASPVSSEIIMNASFSPAIAGHNFFIASTVANQTGIYGVTGFSAVFPNNSVTQWTPIDSSQQISYYVDNALDNLNLFATAYKEYI